MLLLLSFLAHSIIRFLSKQIVHQNAPNDNKEDHTSEQNNSDAENEVFLFNESSFANLFESSKFNTIDAAEVPGIDDYINLFNQSEKSFKLLGTDEDFFSELTEETLKSLEISGFDLNDNENQLLDSSPASSPRFNSLFNSLSSMDIDLNQMKDSNDSTSAMDNYNFFEDERLINESIIASCTLTSDMNIRDLNTTSSSNVSQVSSENTGCQVSTPKQRGIRKQLSLRNKVLSKVKCCDNSFQQSPKNKRFLPKKERNRIAGKFNKRARTSSKINNVKLVEFNNSLLKKMSKNLKLASYKPSTKVEKLLNDTRGMRKYMIDYDGLMTQRQQNFVNLTYASLVNITANATLESSRMISYSLKTLSSTPRINKLDLIKSHLRASIRNRSVCVNQRDLTSTNKLASNRSSSGYLTDC